jgi:hypothetical protein
MGDFREHGVMLYLDRTLYRAFIKLQADKDLGRSYAGLLPFVEGLYAMGYIDEQVYVQHKERYSAPLIVEKPLQHFVDKESEQLNKTLGATASQWDLHPDPLWRQRWISIAELHPTLPNSKLVLAKRPPEREVGESHGD